jgi:ABC-type multidrug transport system fused ATPase/permease subunit
METVMFATIMFFMVGFGDREFVNYLVYLSILLVFALLMNQQLAVFASFASASTLQACSACLLLLLILLGGFIIAPDIIPNYLIWIYWWNPFAWTYRALIVNEFRSASYEDPDEILITLGFVLENGDPFGQEWVGYSFAYLIPYLVLCAVLTGLGLTYVKDAGGAAPDPMAGHTPNENGEDDEDDRATIEIPFKAVDLSFSDICYEVKASTSKKQLKLLNNVNGIFRGGRLCALMGSSGAGKTTLMVRTRRQWWCWLCSELYLLTLLSRSH